MFFLRLRLDDLRKCLVFFNDVLNTFQGGVKGRVDTGYAKFGCASTILIIVCRYSCVRHLGAFCFDTFSLITNLISHINIPNDDTKVHKSATYLYFDCTSKIANFDVLSLT